LEKNCTLGCRKQSTKPKMSLNCSSNFSLVHQRSSSGTQSGGTHLRSSSTSNSFSSKDLMHG
jgi:hypothetical protein